MLGKPANSSTTSSAHLVSGAQTTPEANRSETALTLDIIDNGLKPVKQDHKEATYCKRRKPEESEITLSEIKNKDSIYIYNKIRMLADPYPNAFIKTSDGKKIIIKDAFIVD